MNILQKKIATTIATGAMFFNVVTPALATALEISGNGSSSDNTVELEVQHSTEVYQTNVADVYNQVDANASTGGNDANDNTGGDVSIDTGNAKTLVDVTNTLNSNSASVGCCQSSDVDVLISGNGSDSENTVDLDINSESKGPSTLLVQSNYADVTNKVDANAKTGYNDAEDNTGGSVSIDTGDAKAGVSLSTSANSNTARIGGGGGEGGSISARILGNGTESDNTIELEFNNDVAVFQTNVADIFNGVWADAKTGGNDANDNTGGDTSIDTGDATVGVEIDNMVNFNWADVDCGCLFDVLAKIAGNGSDSENKIEAELGDGLLVAQGNCDYQETVWEGPRSECETENKVDAEAKTGYNDAEDNTGSVEGGDPSVDTGNALTGVSIENTGNANVFGSGLDFPEIDWNFDFGLNLAFFWAWLSGSN